MSWSPCGADLVVAGLLIGVVGSAVWIKGQIFRPDLTQETTIFLGQNPFQIKTAINQRWESLTAFALSFAISIVGTIQGAQDQACIGSWVRIHPSLLVTLLACGGVGLFLLSLWASKRCAMCEALPRLVELQREILDLGAHVVRHGGLRRDQLNAPGYVLSPELRNEQMKEAKRRLEQVGSLVEITRHPGEDDERYARRLEAFFEKYPPPQQADNVATGGR